MATLTTVNTRDLEFILGLNKKLHFEKECSFDPNLSGKSLNVKVDQYTNKSMTEEEMQKLFRVLERNDFIFYPINTSMGFAVGFTVANSTENYKENLLTFRESQLPKGYDFKKMSEYFMRPENLERAELAEIKIENNPGHYDY